VSNWPATKARRVLAALQRIGWVVKRQSGSHRTLSRPDRPNFVFAFHDDEELGSRILARIAKHTGLTPSDLSRGMPRRLESPSRRRHSLSRARLLAPAVSMHQRNSGQDMVGFATWSDAKEPESLRWTRCARSLFLEYFARTPLRLVRRSREGGPHVILQRPFLE
jgi:predicted RNA binding protein YcfA (HicA-like mRNA interferase family)